MNIYEIMTLSGIETIHEFIEMIKLQGELIENNGSVLQLPNNQFAERAIIFFDSRFYVTYIVLDTLEETVHWEDIKVFEFEWQARDFYDALLRNLNSEIYE